MSTEELDLTEVPKSPGASGSSGSWVPQACVLPTAEQPLRVAEFDDLFASAVRQLDRPELVRLRMELEPTPEVAATTAGLVARETACCSFFTFTLTATAGQLALEVAVAPAHVEVLAALATRAALASAGTVSAGTVS